MNRLKVSSSNIHSIGHDENGLEVQFHRAGCARMSKAAVDTDSGEKRQAACNCAGGDVWLYEGVPAEVHSMVIHSPSIGRDFNRLVKIAKNDLGFLLYPAVKRATEYTGI